MTEDPYLAGIMARQPRTDPEARAMTHEWQPIETAPKDGTDILFFGSRNGVWFGRYNPAPKGWCLGLPTDGESPTHWMPLPDPPRPAP